MSKHDSEALDNARVEVLQIAENNYEKSSPEYTAFIAGAGYMISQHMGTMTEG